MDAVRPLLSEVPGKLSDELFHLVKKATDPAERMVLQEASKLVREVERVVWNNATWAREWAYLVLVRALPYESLPPHAKEVADDPTRP